MSPGLPVYLSPYVQHNSTWDYGIHLLTCARRGLGGDGDVQSILEEEEDEGTPQGGSGQAWEAQGGSQALLIVSPVLRFSLTDYNRFLGSAFLDVLTKHIDERTALPM